MAEITAAMVKDLREKTAAGMMDCKKALQATDGNLDAAVTWLREKGLAAVIEAEKSIAREKAKAEGKPEKILDKIAEGAANKWFADNVLLEQSFVKDDKLTVQKHIEKVAKELGTEISVKAMHRFKVGEGLEKRADDFAAEVAKMAGTA